MINLLLMKAYIFLVLVGNLMVVYVLDGASKKCFNQLIQVHVSIFVHFISDLLVLMGAYFHFIRGAI